MALADRTDATGFAQQPPPVHGYRVEHFEAYIVTMSRQLEVLLARGDYRAVFHLTYLTFSRQILAALKVGRFSDPGWATDMCCRFVEAYVEQVARWDREDPEQCRAWRVAFGRAEAGRANVLQAMLLGMNAHINYDLAFVTLGACRHAGDLAGEDVTGRALSASLGGVPVSRYRDFLLVNQVGWESIPLIQDTVLAAFSRWLYWGNRATLRATRFLGQRLLIEARDSSWCHTCLLIHARDGEERAAVARAIDAHAASMTDLVGMLTAQPAALWSSARSWGRRWETLAPETGSGLLGLARGNAVVAELALRQLASSGAPPVSALLELLEAGEPRLAAVFAAQVLRHAPAARRQELLRFWTEGSEEALTVLEAVLEDDDGAAGALPTAPVEAVRVLRADRGSRARRFLELPEVAAAPHLADALTRYAEGLERRLAVPPPPSPRTVRDPGPPPTLENAARVLARHPDPWVRLCALDALDAGRQRSAQTPGDAMALLIERVLFLKDTELFMEVEPAVLVHVAEQLEPRAFRAGDPLVRAGEKVGGIHVIREGRVEVSQMRGERRLNIAELGAGDSVGELSALNETPATADCRALEDVATFFLPSHVLAALLHRHPRLAIGLIRLLSRRLVSTTLRLGAGGD